MTRLFTLVAIVAILTAAGCYSPDRAPNFQEARPPEELERFRWEIKRGCRTDRIDYVDIDTSMPLDVALTSYLATRAEMKLS